MRQKGPVLWLEGVVHTHPGWVIVRVLLNSGSHNCRVSLVSTLTAQCQVRCVRHYLWLDTIRKAHPSFPPIFLLRHMAVQLTTVDTLVRWHSQHPTRPTLLQCPTFSKHFTVICFPCVFLYVRETRQTSQRETGAWEGWVSIYHVGLLMSGKSFTVANICVETMSRASDTTVVIVT